MRGAGCGATDAGLWALAQGPVFVAIIAAASGCSQVPPSQVPPLALPLEVDPLALSETYWILPIRQPGGLMPDDPQTCGGCHQEQLHDWQQSLHARANSVGLRGQLIAASPAFVKGCLLCHAPQAHQQPFREHGMLARLRRRTALPGEQSFVEEKIAAYQGGEIVLRPNPDLAAPSTPLGIACAACHVRGGRVHAPPSDGSPPAIVGGARAPHGAVVRSPYFESAEFCAECHQFTMRSRAGSKPIQNTYEEWRHSPYAAANMTCVRCHMPDRAHHWRGIHDPAMVRRALGADVELRREGSDVVATLVLTNQGAGHALPTYVTPRIVGHIRLLDEGGEVLGEATLPLQREVRPGHPWQEIADTRLLPLASRRVDARAPAAAAAWMESWVDVDPDHFYRGVYDGLLEGALQPQARNLIEEARKGTDASRFSLYHERTSLGAVAALRP